MLNRAQRARSACTSQRQARPGIHDPEDFADNVESVTGTAPPMARVKGIVCGGANYSAAFSRSKLSPKQPRTARMGLAGDQNDRTVFFWLERFTNHADFVGCVDDRCFQNVNGVCRDSCVNQNAGAVNLFSFEANSHGIQGFSGFRSASEPNLRRITLAIKLGRFQGADRHSSAEDGNSACLTQGIFHDEPPPYTEKCKQHQGQEATSDGGKNKSASVSRPDNSGSGVWGISHRKLAHAIPSRNRGQLARL